MKVPYVDIARRSAEHRGELLAAAGRVLDHGKFILGPEVAEFESRFAALCGTTYAVGLNSGMDALTLSLEAWGIGEGDEVITQPNSFVASTSCIVRVGARPVFADVGADYNLDPARVAAAITPRTKALLPVHLTGRPSKMNELMEIARSNGLMVIEDAAQAVGATLNGRAVGSFGSAGCFSLHPLKNLSASGDGGVVTTNDESVAEQLKIKRNLGLRTRDDCVEFAGNSRLDTLQAAMLLVKMQYLEKWTQARRHHAARYRDLLAGIEQVSMPDELPGELAVYHTFVIRASARAELRAFLEQNGIGTQIHYPVPIHLSTAGRALGYARGDFPETERQAEEILSLPIQEDLSERDVEYVAEKVKKFYA